MLLPISVALREVSPDDSMRRIPFAPCQNAGTELASWFRGGPCLMGQPRLQRLRPASRLPQQPAPLCLRGSISPSLSTKGTTVWLVGGEVVMSFEKSWALPLSTSVPVTSLAHLSWAAGCGSPTLRALVDGLQCHLLQVGFRAAPQTHALIRSPGDLHTSKVWGAQAWRTGIVGQGSPQWWSSGVRCWSRSSGTEQGILLSRGKGRSES